MPIESICQGCQKRLRVADEHAGKLARCPHCQAIYKVPQPQSLSPDPAVIATSDKWRMKIANGLVYGPVSRAELDRWLTEGRITADCQLLPEGQQQWIWATDLYPQLKGTVPGALPTTFPGQPEIRPGAPNPFSDQVSNNPYHATVAAGMPYPQHYSGLKQHRGGAILAMSLVGMFFCVIIDFVALIMGAMDLAEMNKGTMDPSGRGLTIAGMVISALHLALIGLYVLVMIVANV